jgi:hypothetical protein
MAYFILCSISRENEKKTDNANFEKNSPQNNLKKKIAHWQKTWKNQSRDFFFENFDIKYQAQ